VGTKGNRLYSVRDINQNVYNNDTEGDELSGRPYITKFPYLNYIDMLENYDFSIYYSLQVTLKQQSTNGLFFVAGYTWAHSIDNGSSNRSANVQNSYDIAAERGDSDFDVRNRFTFDPPPMSQEASLDMPSSSLGGDSTPSSPRRVASPSISLTMAMTSVERGNTTTAGTFTAIPRIFTGRGAKACRGMSSTPIIPGR
jgi:hypothetical protein